MVEKLEQVRQASIEDIVGMEDTVKGTLATMYAGAPFRPSLRNVASPSILKPVLIRYAPVLSLSLH